MLRLLGVGALGLAVVGAAALDARAGRLPFNLGRKALHVFKPAAKPGKKVVSKPSGRSGLPQFALGATPVRVPFIPPSRSPYRPPNRGHGPPPGVPPGPPNGVPPGPP